MSASMTKVSYQNDPTVMTLNPGDMPLCISPDVNMRNIRECKTAAQLDSYFILRGFVQGLTDLAVTACYHQYCYWQWKSRPAGIALWRVGLLSEVPR